MSNDNEDLEVMITPEAELASLKPVLNCWV